MLFKNGNSEIIMLTLINVLHSFGIMRDYALKFRELSVFVCIDGKHRIKVG